MHKKDYMSYMYISKKNNKHMFSITMTQLKK